MPSRLTLSIRTKLSTAIPAKRRYPETIPFLRFLGEAITNLSGHEVQVACPVVRDRRRGTGTLADGSAAAIVVSVDGRGNEVHCMVAWG
jgi:acyl-coenzyme A thioesterase PaaI-like protein